MKFDITYKVFYSSIKTDRNEHSDFFTTVDGTEKAACLLEKLCLLREDDAATPLIKFALLVEKILTGTKIDDNDCHIGTGIYVKPHSWNESI